MKRIAFTILLNGLHHLTHNDYYKFILENFDYWIIVEGASNNTGSTSWCNAFPKNFSKENGESIDGTTEFLTDISKKYKNLIHIKPIKMWNNKDDQVNTAIQEIKKITNTCLLWEIDIDEQWNLEDIKTAEAILIREQAKTGCFLCTYFVGKNKIATGEWGEGTRSPYRRLWNWSGELFKSHEPPVLDGKNGPGILIPIKFNHYAFYFDQDVRFKEIYYKYIGLYDRWLNLQKETNTVHISKLLGTDIHWGNTNTYIRSV